jgi:hypothetical protein
MEWSNEEEEKGATFARLRSILAKMPSDELSKFLINHKEFEISPAVAATRSKRKILEDLKDCFVRPISLPSVMPLTRLQDEGVSEAQIAAADLWSTTSASFLAACVPPLTPPPDSGTIQEGEVGRLQAHA